MRKVFDPGSINGSIAVLSVHFAMIDADLQNTDLRSFLYGMHTACFIIG